ncbi:adenosine receptor A3-like [Stylophora pistillata]|uniref:adenosine receptor A3-like n=1 Tax=Stylophora pistillata TaxID=50429 RepID=UPI000C039024|nr:adenosine receptor A3-like [Stylophora pistillata]
MTSSPNKRTYSNTIHEPWRPVSASQCIPWFAVLGTECLTIVILNVIIIIVFVKQRQLQRRSTYLIIHQTIVDLLVGLVSGPLLIEMYGSWYCGLWKDRYIAWLSILRVAGIQFIAVSLLSLAVISLERVHATFRPYKHRFIKKWVYGMIITVIWLVHIFLMTIANHTYFHVSSDLMYFSYFFTLVFFVVICYISIYLKVRCSNHPQHHGAANLRERKLSSTLFLVSLCSLITFLPLIVYWGCVLFSTANFSIQSAFPFLMVRITFAGANSLINPLVYAIRMPEVRRGILQIIFRRASNRVNPVNIQLQNLARGRKC